VIPAIRILSSLVSLFLAAGCAVVPTEPYVESKPLSEPAPWHFYADPSGARFWYGENSVTINPHVFQDPAGLRKGPMIVNVCYRVHSGSPDFDAQMSLGTATATADMKQVVFGRVVKTHETRKTGLGERPDPSGMHRESIKDQCWDLAFDIALRDPASSFVVHLAGLQGPRGEKSPALPPVQYNYVPPGHRVCILYECLVSL
jgi:hypothetical protein